MFIFLFFFMFFMPLWSMEKKPVKKIKEKSTLEKRSHQMLFSDAIVRLYHELPPELQAETSFYLCFPPEKTCIPTKLVGPFAKNLPFGYYKDVYAASPQLWKKHTHITGPMPYGKDKLFVLSTNNYPVIQYLIVNKNSVRGFCHPLQLSERFLGVVPFTAHFLSTTTHIKKIFTKKSEPPPDIISMLSRCIVENGSISRKEIWRTEGTFEKAWGRSDGSIIVQHINSRNTGQKRSFYLIDSENKRTLLDISGLLAQFPLGNITHVHYAATHPQILGIEVRQRKKERSFFYFCFFSIRTQQPLFIFNTNTVFPHSAYFVARRWKEAYLNPYCPKTFAQIKNTDLEFFSLANSSSFFHAMAVHDAQNLISKHGWNFEKACGLLRFVNTRMPNTMFLMYTHGKLFRQVYHRVTKTITKASLLRDPVLKPRIKKLISDRTLFPLVTAVEEISEETLKKFPEKYMFAVHEENIEPYLFSTIENFEQFPRFVLFMDKNRKYMGRILRDNLYFVRDVRKMLSKRKTSVSIF
ncbi:MAG TPA: hypothetical protein VEK38_03290 [Candidatus Bathyarchaeia archaeon]|nr:hypothetical protein [Candidatus Bathyarchaeia archaeon]